ncbi:MAG: hypothetical protein NUV57_01410, partial [archaeon]|nr:hypothetical protein [archaeon]
FALFELVKLHKYNPANSLIRTIWETNQLLGAIEENPEEAKEIYSQIRKEIIEGDEKVQKKEITPAELSLQDHDYVNKVQAFRRKYKVKLEKTDEIHKRVHNYLSNSKVHPAQIDGLNLDDSFHFESEAQLAELMIGFTYGMLRKFHNLFADYLNEDELLELQAIRKQIEEECPDGILTICY